MDYLIISITLVGITLYGLLSQANLLKTLISIELLTATASMNFIFLAYSAFQTLGQVFLVLTLSTDSCITAIILAVLIVSRENTARGT